MSKIIHQHLPNCLKDCHIKINTNTISREVKKDPAENKDEEKTAEQEEGALWVRW